MKTELRRRIFTAGISGLALLGSLIFLQPERGGVSASTQASLSKERILDRLSLALTGRVFAALSQTSMAALKTDFLEGKKSADDVVQALVETDAFLTTAAAFWLTKMKITGITDFENIRTVTNNTVMQGISPQHRTMTSRTLEWVPSTAVIGRGFFRLTSEFENTLQDVRNDTELSARIANKAKVECSLTLRTFTRNDNRICPSPYNNFPIPTTDTQKATCMIPIVTADDINSNSVTPWFAPGRETRVCAGVTDRCGYNLQNCFPSGNIAGNINANNGPINTFIPNLRADFTFEPGILAAGIIQSNRAWEDVLRATDGPLSGALEFFLSSKWGARVMENMPPGSYSRDGEPLLSADRSVADRKWEWRERGNLHAGVLTTVAFQKAFNGWRAKSAGSMEAFLCRVFIVPEGVAVLPSAEVDLTRKPYCQSCHSVLEPLSLFFGRWQNLGSTNFRYDAGTDRVASGTFENMSNADTAGLAKVYTSTQDFHDCGVHRAFELMVGRSMNTEEVTTMFPHLQKAYRNGGNKLLPVLKEIASGPLFLRSRQ